MSYLEGGGRNFLFPHSVKYVYFPIGKLIDGCLPVYFAKVVLEKAKSWN